MSGSNRFPQAFAVAEAIAAVMSLTPADQRIVYGALGASLYPQGGPFPPANQQVSTPSPGATPIGGGGRGRGSGKSSRGRGKRGRGRGRGGRGGRVITPSQSPALQRYLTWKGQHPGVDPKTDPVAQRYYAEYQADLAAAREAAGKLRADVDDATSSLGSASIGGEAETRTAHSSDSRKRRRDNAGAPVASPREGEDAAMTPTQESEAQDTAEPTTAVAVGWTRVGTGPGGKPSPPAQAGTISGTR